MLMAQVVVGTNSGAGALSYQAFRWSGGTMNGLGFLPGGSYSEATATNPSGSMVIGFGDSNRIIESFLWTSSTGMVGLGFLPDGLSVQANAMDADGSVIGGQSANGNAAIWTESTGWLLVIALLTARGNNNDLQGWDLTTVTGISADGTIIVGDGYDPSGKPEAWMAQISLKAPPIDPVPLPATLPLFATGLGALGLLGWHRRRKM